jgi:hypothetical protein
MPTVRSGTQTEQNVIRYKNALAEAEDKLESHGLRPNQISAFLEEPRRFVPQNDFWQHQEEGLALFASESTLQVFRLPIQFSQAVVVADHFYLRPLLEALTRSERYYLLAVSLGRARLFAADRFRIQEVRVPDMPEGLADTLRYDQPQKQVHSHTRRPERSGGRSAVFHGHGLGEDEGKRNISRYMHDVKNAVERVLAGLHVPLVMAGEEHLVPVYREASGYHYLVDDTVYGNADHLDEAELHHRSWQIVEPYFKKDQSETIDSYRQLADTNRATNRVDSLVSASRNAQVDRLIVDREAVAWGSVDEASGSVTVHEERQPGDEDLLDRIVVETLLNGGMVFTVDASQVPDDAPVAALLRYESA